MKRWIACILTAAMAAYALPADSWAMLAPADVQSGDVASGYDRAADMKTVQSALELKIVRERLKDLGLDDAQIESRLSRLSDQDIQQLAAQAEALQPGGDAVVWILTVAVLVALFIFLYQRIK